MGSQAKAVSSIFFMCLPEQGGRRSGSRLYIGFCWPTVGVGRRSGSRLYIVHCTEKLRKDGLVQGIRDFGFRRRSRRSGSHLYNITQRSWVKMVWFTRLFLGGLLPRTALPYSSPKSAALQFPDSMRDKPFPGLRHRDLPSEIRVWSIRAISPSEITNPLPRHFVFCIDATLLTGIFVFCFV
jgi:hypothetical protein